MRHQLQWRRAEDAIGVLTRRMAGRDFVFPPDTMQQRQVGGERRDAVQSPVVERADIGKRRRGVEARFEGGVHLVQRAQQQHVVPAVQAPAQEPEHDPRALGLAMQRRRFVAEALGQGGGHGDVAGSVAGDRGGA